MIYIKNEIKLRRRQINHLIRRFYKSSIQVNFYSGFDILVYIKIGGYGND